MTYITEAEPGDDDDHHFTDHPIMDDCDYNITGDWCITHIHQALEISWLILMDMMAISFMFYLWKYRDFYSDPTIKHGVNAFKLKVLSSLSLGAVVHTATCVWMVLTSASYSRENPEVLKYLIVADNVCDLCFYSALVLFIHAMNRDLLNETMTVRVCLGVILAAIVSHWLYLFMGTGFDACDSWYDYKEENDVMYSFINVFDSIARVMETEGTIFIFEWYYIMWLSVHQTEKQLKNNRKKMRKVSHEGRITRSEKALREMGLLPKEVHFGTADNLDSISNQSRIDNGDMEAMYMETFAKENYHSHKTTIQSITSKNESITSVSDSWKSDNDGDNESLAGEEVEDYERRDTNLVLEQKMPKSALKFRLERRIDPLPTAMIEKKATIPVQLEPRSTAMSMASMVSQKITMADGAESVVDGNDRSARRSYIFNDYRVEETYAGPGSELSM